MVLREMCLVKFFEDNKKVYLEALCLWVGIMIYLFDVIWTEYFQI